MAPTDAADAPDASHVRDAPPTSPSASRVWTCELRGHRYELVVTPSTKARVVLRVDGEQVYDKAELGDDRTIPVPGGRRVRVWLTVSGAVKRATVFDHGVDMDFDAPPGTRAARVQAWGRRHPVLFALRHVLVKGGGILVALLGLGALMKALVEPLLRWIADHMPDIDWPEIPWPRIDLPDIPWPEVHLPRIPWPDIPWPQVTLPWWLQQLLQWLGEHEDIVKPLFIGVVLAVAEMRRQRRQRRLREAAASGEPAAPGATSRWRARLDGLLSQAAAGEVSPLHSEARRREHARFAADLHALLARRTEDDTPAPEPTHTTPTPTPTPTRMH